MENSNLEKSLLSESSYISQEHQQNNVKAQILSRSTSDPVTASMSKEVNYELIVSTPEPHIPRMHPSFKKISGFLSIYLVVGAICFYIIDEQLRGIKTSAVVDAIYFCIVTMTTVGYGDLVPDTSLAKLLACAFVFSGMALVGLGLSKGADYLVEKQEALLIRAVKMRKRKKLRAEDFGNEIEAKKLRYKCLSVIIVLLILLISGTVFLNLVEKMDLIDAFYCACVTVTSLGYGDNSFTTMGGRVFAIVWILASTICVAQLIFYIAEINTERRQNAMVKWVLTRRVTMVDLEAADLDNDGVVNAAEFVLYKLKEMRKITQGDISLLMAQFKELDNVDQSGSLSLHRFEASSMTSSER